MKTFECIQLLERSNLARKPSNDYRRWPKPYRLAVEASIKRKMAEMPKGSKLKKVFSSCDRRADLASLPWQLYVEMTVA